MAQRLRVCAAHFVYWIYEIELETFNANKIKNKTVIVSIYCAHTVECIGVATSNEHHDHHHQAKWLFLELNSDVICIFRRKIENGCCHHRCDCTLHKSIEN